MKGQYRTKIEVYQLPGHSMWRWRAMAHFGGRPSEKQGSARTMLPAIIAAEKWVEDQLARRRRALVNRAREAQPARQK